MNKVYDSAFEAIFDVTSGSSMLFGGFGLTGIPENAIDALLAAGTAEILCISNEAGIEGFGLGKLVASRAINKLICSYVGENHLLEALILEGHLSVELVPQGTLAERIRCGGAGIPAFFTPAGVGTEVAEGKEVREFGGKKYLLETALTADFAFVKAWKGDTDGNLIYKGTSRNFNPVIAPAGRITIAEVEELVPAGTLDPNEIHTPGIYVQRIFQGSNYVKPIEKFGALAHSEDEQKEIIARRLAKEIKDGDYVNLGIGIPTRVSNHIPPGMKVILQSENGLLGIGPLAEPGQEDPDLINASKRPITILKGGSLFSSAESFAMIRGDHIDVTILGGMQVSERGDLANWKVPGKMVKGMGGAMDLVASADRVIVAMLHLTSDGKSKLVSACDLPLTGERCVTRIITDLAVIDINPEGGFLLKERAHGVSIEQIKAATAGRLLIPDVVPEF
ncbi:3-oxoacid CoA-transferase [Aquirufa antheringensis]|jgi:3-oxoacid CoA-transferase|uniref:3-oxoacid CoA-transferase subunit B n=1 Tax=Aquirufa antheringensis TaxID=2516559 RepID=A0A4Q9BFD7_9BACT|nr:3-oxoacid CoA-transferase [Aquirufa antheringensis]MCZ2484290.1 3-oxoacid CoA-transferase subunit B [Aquirufa antheringensis]MCZ2489334.1 3-oxoacid CoA-transferase subunit B [Aquirufa antheringensis]TBH74501.1 3-oxoacid CoA-transferase subunit B [Aquirufa antheringensis]